MSGGQWIQDPQIFAGFYDTNSTHVQVLQFVTHDALLRVNLSVMRLKGQCYDGSTSMSEAHGEVAKMILDEEPKAMHTHCYRQRQICGSTCRYVIKHEDFQFLFWFGGRKTSVETQWQHNHDLPFCSNLCSWRTEGSRYDCDYTNECQIRSILVQSHKNGLGTSSGRFGTSTTMKRPRILYFL